jgi:hypothetical protein
MLLKVWHEHNRKARQHLWIESVYSEPVSNWDDYIGAHSVQARKVDQSGYRVPNGS